MLVGLGAQWQIISLIGMKWAMIIFLEYLVCFFGVFCFLFFPFVSFCLSKVIDLHKAQWPKACTNVVKCSIRIWTNLFSLVSSMRDAMKSMHLWHFIFNWLSVCMAGFLWKWLTITEKHQYSVSYFSILEIWCLFSTYFQILTPT